MTAGGPPAASPIIGPETTDISNPVPQALALTAIVISFGLTLFLLALAARQQTLTGDDLVEDDLEDQRIATAAEQPDDDSATDGETADGETTDGETTLAQSGGDVTNLIALTIMAPLLTAAVGFTLRSRPVLRDTVTIAGLATAAASAIALLVGVANNGTVVVQVGGWNPELGIVLVADLFAVLTLPVALTIVLVVEIFAIGQRRTAWGANPELSGPLLGVLTAGVSLAFLTGDLFTLFVAFEMILVSSYVLLTHQGRRGQIRSGMTYVAMNLFASTLFLFGLAFVYAATGTVNMALLAERMPRSDHRSADWNRCLVLYRLRHQGRRLPLFSWLPDSYPTAPTTITAVFAGLLTKIGIYAMIRFHTLTGMDDARTGLPIGGRRDDDHRSPWRTGPDRREANPVVPHHQPDRLHADGSRSVLRGRHHRRHPVSHSSHAGEDRAVPRRRADRERSGHQLAGTLRRARGRRPLIAVLFAIPALSLAGLPPFSGFVAKLAVISAGIEASANLIVTAALVAGALTLLSMAKIWLGVFWGPPPEQITPVPTAVGDRRTMQAATALAVAGSLTISFFAGTLLT